MKYGKKIASLFMTMLIVSMFAVAPAMACEPGTSCGNGASVSDPIEVTGKERQVFLDDVLKDEDIMKFTGQLEDKEYKQTGIDVYRLEITPEEGSAVTVKIVSINYESADGETEQIHYMYNEDSGEVVILSGPMSCVNCLGGMVFGGLACSTICVVSGVLTWGVSCVGCILLAGGVALCPCYECACAAGYDDACYKHDLLC